MSRFYDCLHKTGKGVLCNAEQQPKFEVDRPGYRQTLKRIVTQKRKTTLPQLISEMDMEF